MKKRVTVITIGTVATIMVAGMALAGCNKNVATNVAPTTTAEVETTTTVEVETTTTVAPETTEAEAETTTTVEVETTTAVETTTVAPETTTVEAETTTTAEVETTTVAPETTTAEVETTTVEPETTTTVEPETTTITVEVETTTVEVETTVVEPETTTAVAEPETTTVEPETTTAVAEPVKDYVEFKVKDEFGRNVIYRVYGDAPVTPLEDWQTHAMYASNSLHFGIYYDNVYEPTYITAWTFENTPAECDKDIELAATLKEKYNLPNGSYKTLNDLQDDLENYYRLTSGINNGYAFDLDGKWIYEFDSFVEPLEFNEDGTKWLDSYTLEWFDTPSPSMGDEGLAALWDYYGDREAVRRVILNMNERGLEVGQYWYARVNLCDYGYLVYRVSETEVVSYGSSHLEELLADYPDAVYWGEVR